MSKSKLRMHESFWSLLLETVWVVFKLKTNKQTNCGHRTQVFFLETWVSCIVSSISTAASVLEKGLAAPTIILLGVCLLFFQAITIAFGCVEPRMQQQGWKFKKSDSRSGGEDELKKTDTYSLHPMSQSRRQRRLFCRSCFVTFLHLKS